MSGTGLSESTHVQIPHCWKSHVAARYYVCGSCKFNSGGTMKAPFIICVAPITQVTHVRNKNSNIQGRSLNVIK